VHAPEKLDDPFASYRRVSQAVQWTWWKKFMHLKKQAAFATKGSPEAFEFTARRLAAGSQMLLDLWYTAWLESAVALPSPERSAPPPY